MTTQDYQNLFHEIKNNITFITSSLQLVEKKHPEIKDFSYWNDAMQEISSLKVLLIELCSARLSEKLQLQKSSLYNFFSEVAESCLLIFSDTNFRCEFKLEPSLPEISFNHEHLKRALFNLIKNSCEAMNASGTAYFTVCKNNDFIRFDLLDFGGGIDSDFLPKLFQPLETTKPDGTGLGLLITKQIIEAHGGHITVDSRPQDGCTFSIYLPCT